MKKIASLAKNPLVLSVGITLGLFIVLVLVVSPKLDHASEPDLASQQDPAQRQQPEPPKPAPFEFAGGGRQLLPNYRMIALYGTPGSKALGSLGEQELEPAINRIKDLTAAYDPYSDEPLLPAFEIITTVASAGATNNGDYSNELDISKIKPWVDAAKQHGVYVILDLQPGRTDFLTQAKMYEELLKEPHVGLALDPEWRLGPNDVHMKKVGSVSSEEINQTSAWLADLTKANDLPQKLLLIHQFKLSMIGNIGALDTSRSELAYLIQMDGLGAQNVKQDTWRNVIGQNIPNMHYGWKNFYDEDKPMLTPEQTMTQVVPKPFYVSYQ